MNFQCPNCGQPLEQNETLLRFLSENLANGMVYQIDSGVDGRQRAFSYLSPAIERMHGLKVDDVLRNPMLLYGQLLEEDRLMLAEREAIAYTRRTPLDVETRVRLPSGEIRWRHFVSAPRLSPDGRVLWDGIELDITEQKLKSDALLASEKRLSKMATELRRQSAVLKQKNVALKEVLAQIETDRMETKKLVTVNIEKSIMPILRKMRLEAGPKDQKYLDLLEAVLKDIMSQFGARIASATSLSARELEICNMIKSGLSSKEIAQMLHLSVRTIDTFRNRIRKKLGITSKDESLYTHIQSFSWKASGANVEPY
ncbi:MAG: LuxR C-terminal-related transcriptional regulator [Kiritimatiellae bacterium]|nr:LuxR C-terminal-related transcriptional regulator [Kiritimatiellia bacterium]MDD5520049.1 LuxR C-terminal-related transcriptional regulator [Kiritimatiellia bacterium]